MSLITDSPQINALDPRATAGLQRLAKGNDPKAIKVAAQQFEALFVQMMLKSMRDAMPRDGLFDNDQSKMYESLLDQQMSQVLASKNGMGLAEMIERQLQRQSDPETVLPEGVPLTPRAQKVLLERRTSTSTSTTTSAPINLDPALAALARGETEAPAHVKDFVARYLPDAQQAAKATGIPPVFLLAHAALESGWGKHEPKLANGQPSHNLFGIKAGASWSGDKVMAATTEVVQGVAQRRTEPFRVYGSYAEGFSDYAKLLADNPRYNGVVGSRDADAFAQGLQRAGYATDPNYASKLRQVIERLS
jgi:peptidoglycan hydrolase FlgJ